MVRRDGALITRRVIFGMAKIPRPVRRRRNIKAWISGDGIEPHQCAVFNVSDDGVHLISMLADKIPDSFAIKFSPTSPSNGLCRVIWRANHSLGARYER